MKLRSIYLIPALALAYLSGANAIVNATRFRIPTSALLVDASDAGALVAQANVKWIAAAKEGKALDQERVGKAGLLGLPLSAAALRMIAYSADMKRDAKRAKNLNLLAAKVNRREKGAQLWLLQAAVARNDVQEALARYDILLSTDYTVREALFTQLGIALTDRAIREAFVPYIRKNPNWLVPFVGFASGSSPAPDALSLALRQSNSFPDTDDAHKAESSLLSQLFAKEKFDEARAFYLTLKGARGPVTVSSTLDNANTDPRFAPMTWQMERGANVGAELLGVKNALKLSVFALSGANGLAASKYLYLSAGSYRFLPQHEVTLDSANARASWTIRCMGVKGASAIYQYDIIRSASSGQSEDTFNIGLNCPVQRLDLNVAGGDDSAGLEIVISRASILR